MKTIKDIMSLCWSTIGVYCDGVMCEKCSKHGFCYAYVTLLAFDMLSKAGEYH